VKSIKFTEARLTLVVRLFTYVFLPAVAERLKGRSCFGHVDLWSCDLSFIH